MTRLRSDSDNEISVVFICLTSRLILHIYYYCITICVHQAIWNGMATRTYIHAYAYNMYIRQKPIRVKKYRKSFEKNWHQKSWVYSALVASNFRHLSSMFSGVLLRKNLKSIDWSIDWSIYIESIGGNNKKITRKWWLIGNIKRFSQTWYFHITLIYLKANIPKYDQTKREKSISITF